MDEKTCLDQRIDSGKPILLAEIAPPVTADADAVRAAAKRYAGKVHALGVSDNRDKVRMSAMAAASVVAGSGVEPILHVVTRDRNRVALMSECLGAQALGVRNVLCTTGAHQTLGLCRAARNVFDVDSIQLLRMYGELGGNGSGAGGNGSGRRGSLCLGAAASPFADPLDMQVIKLAKKVAAGARFVITDPVFDVDRFKTWWAALVRRDLHNRVAVIAGILPLTDGEGAKAYAERPPRPMIPAAVLQRVCSPSDEKAQRAAGVQIAVETIRNLSGLAGLRGFEIRSDGDDEAVLEVIAQSGLRCD